MKIAWKTPKEENGKKRSRYKSISANPNLPFESGEEMGKQDNSVESDSQHLAESFESQGIQLAENGRFSEALAKWETAITLTPDKAKLHEQKAQILLELGETWNAIKSATRATELDPAWAEAWITLGRAQLNFGEPDMAIDSFEKALALKPDHEEARADRQSASHLVRRRKQLHSSGLTTGESRFRVQHPDGSPSSS